MPCQAGPGALRAVKLPAEPMLDKDPAPGLGEGSRARGDPRYVLWPPPKPTPRRPGLGPRPH
ncbi:hypothetical protein GCM10010234_64150 [Streptomyces hawaiiensis]